MIFYYYIIKANSYIKQLSDRRDVTRVIVHIDMDAFYANIEIRDNKSLKDVPMAVGSESMLVSLIRISFQF